MSETYDIYIFQNSVWAFMLAKSIDHQLFCVVMTLTS